MGKVVVTVPGSARPHTFHGCVVDEFTPGEVTVTSLEHCRQIPLFREGEWLHATAYDDLGYPVAIFSASGRPPLRMVS